MAERRFKNKVAVVLGGAQGIGAATVSRLYQEGAQVVIGDINAEEGEKMVSSLGGDRAFFQQANLSDKDSLVALIQFAADKLGGLDCLANIACAGHPGDRGDISTVDEDLIDHFMGINVKGFMVTCKEAIPLLLKRGGGSIVQVSSQAGQFGGSMASLPVYGMHKSAIDSLTRHIAARYGKQNIRCNGVAPGMTMTEMVRANAKRLPDFDRMLEATPGPGFCDPEDIASVIAFLLSNDAKAINAQTVLADIGQTAISFPAPA